MTFRGLMSCQCRQQCERKFGGVMRRHPPLCWDWDDTSRGQAAAAAASINLSDYPVDAAAVVFRAPSWPPMGKCARNPSGPRCPPLSRSHRRAVNTLGGMPLPNNHCPRSCSHRGTCLLPMSEPPTAQLINARERFPLSVTPPAGAPGCICHDGYSGAGCEVEDNSRCFNRCSGAGVCVGRFCLCDRGRMGVDCSLTHTPRRVGYSERVGASRGATSTSAAMAAAVDAGTRYVPTYVYPLPTAWSLEAVYQRDMDRRGQYYANLMYLEQLMRRRDSIVADPEQAALFFVPVMVMQMAGNLWHPYEFLTQTAHHLQHSYPYWNRSAGRDHVFFLTTDRAGCWKPWALQHSIIVTYLGFPASEGYFGFEERLRWPRRGPNRRNNAYSVRPGSEALELDCYVPTKDVVVPVDAQVGGSEEAKLHRPGAAYTCNTARSTLMFMGGAMSNMGRVEYSQGVRQAIKAQHPDEKGFVLGGKFTLDQLRDSRFCLCPSGWGWGWRLSLAVITQCVPVIIQPNVTQPFEALLPYASFSIRLEKEDIPQLPQILKAVTDDQVCRMQRNLARYYRALLWQQPFGGGYANAYDLMQLQLCTRAKHLSRRLKLEGRHPDAYLSHHTLSCPETLTEAGIAFE